MVWFSKIYGKKTALLLIILSIQFSINDTFQAYSINNKPNSSNNVIQEQGYNSILLHRHLNQGNYANVSYYLYVDQNDVGSTIQLALTFMGWNQMNLNPSIRSIYLILDQINPLNKLEKNYSIIYGTPSQKITFVPTFTGNYRFELRVPFNFNSFVNVDSQDGDFSTNCNLRVTGLTKAAWVITNYGSINGPVFDNYVNMRNTNDNVLFYLDLNDTGYYTLELQPFAPAIQDLPMDKIYLINNVNNSDQLVLLPPLGEADKFMTFFINQSQTGIWSLSYTPNTTWNGMFYRFQFQDPFNNRRRFYLPLDNSSAPNIKGLIENDRYPSTVIGYFSFSTSTSLPTDFLSILAVLVLLPMFKRKNKKI